MFLPQFLELSQVCEVISSGNISDAGPYCKDRLLTNTGAHRENSLCSVQLVAWGVIRKQTSRSRRPRWCYKDRIPQIWRLALPLPLSNTGGPQDMSTDGRPTYHMSKSLEVVNEAGKLLDKCILSYYLIKYTIISAWKIRFKFRNQLCREGWLPGPLTKVQPLLLLPLPHGPLCACVCPHPYVQSLLAPMPTALHAHPSHSLGSEHAQWWHNLPLEQRMWGRSLCRSEM